MTDCPERSHRIAVVVPERVGVHGQRGGDLRVVPATGRDDAAFRRTG